MKKVKLRKKSLLELMQSSRVPITMNTSQIIITPKKGKGSYKRKTKHQHRELP